MPPVRDQGEPSKARIVTELGKEFNIDEVYQSESSFIGSLKSGDGSQSIEVPPSQPLNFDETMLEDNAQTQPSTTTQGVEDASDGGYDETMAPDAEKVKSKSATSRQNEKLYSEEGMLNTKMKRAENKRRKKAKYKSNSPTDAMDDDDNEDDYDFGVDYVKGKSSIN